ncbi:MAG: ankyrin repeat domain-containing protein [Gammaproteobacteria bacterium]
MKRLCVFMFVLSPCWGFAEDINDLFAAAITGKNARIEALLAQGLDVNGITAGGRTALMGASYNGNVRIVKTLLAYGADVNIADNMGTTALMDALVFGDETLVNLLVAAGADVNAVDKQNITVLGRAKKIGNERLIKALEQAGALEQPVVPADTGEDGENAEDDVNSKATDKSTGSESQGQQKSGKQTK